LRSSSFNDILEIFNASRDLEQVDVGGRLCNGFERLFVFVQQGNVLLFHGVFCVQNLGEVKWNLDVNVSRGGHIMSNIFENQFWFHEVEALRVDELWI